MSGTQQIKNLIPGIITRIAISYPFVYIDSISFTLRSKLIAACFWNHKKTEEGSALFMEMGSDIFPGCYIYQDADDIKTSDVEITGRDEQGRNMLVALPLRHITIGPDFNSNAL